MGQRQRNLDAVLAGKSTAGVAICTPVGYTDVKSLTSAAVSVAKVNFGPDDPLHAGVPNLPPIQEAYSFYAQENLWVIST